MDDDLAALSADRDILDRCAELLGRQTQFATLEDKRACDRLREEVDSRRSQLNRDIQVRQAHQTQLHRRQEFIRRILPLFALMWVVVFVVIQFGVATSWRDSVMVLLVVSPFALLLANHIIRFSRMHLTIVVAIPLTLAATAAAIPVIRPLVFEKFLILSLTSLGYAIFNLLRQQKK